MSAEQRQQHINIKFQEGLISEVGVNGAYIEDVIDIVINRLEVHQEGSFPSVYNETAIHHLKLAKAALEDRTRDRTSRGVEGQYRQ